MSKLVREGVVLAYDDVGLGNPPLVFVHGVACHRGFWGPQVQHFKASHRVLVIDLRGHGESDAPVQRYTIPGFADDLAWTFKQLDVGRPVVIGHSLGGLVGLELAAAHPDAVAAVVLIDSVLLPQGERAKTVRRLVTGLRGDRSERVLRDYFAAFFGPFDDPDRVAWIMDEVIRTPSHVTSSIWEESLRAWDAAVALQRCCVPLLYLDAGTQNADLPRAGELNPAMLLGRTVATGHFSALESPGQVNAMLERFLSVGY